MAIKLYDLTDISSHRETYEEIIRILALVAPAYDPARLAAVYQDIVSLFNGSYPGYRASNTKYHNLEHTCSVTLATARLTHGVHVQGQAFATRDMELGLIGALFHDAGLIQMFSDIIRIRHFRFQTDFESISESAQLFELFDHDSGINDKNRNDTVTCLFFVGLILFRTF